MLSLPPNRHGVRSEVLHCLVFLIHWLCFLVFIMVDKLRKPEPLSFDCKVALNLKNFVQELEIFIAAAQLETRIKRPKRTFS